MQSRSHGRTRPNTGEVPAAESTVELLNGQQSSSSSWSLPVADGAAARIPAVSVKTWTERLPAVLDTEQAREAARRRHTSVATVLTVAKAAASFADSSTGRQITASNASIAEKARCTVPTVKRARWVLSDIGLAVEMVRGRHLSTIERAAARAHHRGFQRTAGSVWALTLPRPTATAPSAQKRPLTPRRRSASLGRVTRCASLAAGASKPAAGPAATDRRDPLPSPTSVGEGSYVPAIENTSFLLVSPGGKKSPTRARAHTRTKNPAKRTGSSERTPRPLHLQRAAAELVAVAHGLDSGQWIRCGGPGSSEYLRQHRGHIGAVADALLEAGIDTTRWSGRAIVARLTRSSVERGLYWPDHIQRPVGFLRQVLARIDWSSDAPRTTPAARPRCADHPFAGRQLDGECPECVIERRAYRRVFRPQRHAVESLPAAAASSEPPVVWSTDGTCTACGSAPGVVREKLPIPVPVCDACWSTVDETSLCDPATTDDRAMHGHQSEMLSC